MKFSSFSLCLSALLALGLATGGVHDAVAASKKAKNIASVMKRGGLSKTPDGASVFRGKKKSSGVSILGAAPSVSEILASGDVDALFWNGMIADVLSGSPSQETCNDFHKGGLVCGLNNDVIDAISMVDSAQTTPCYLKSLTELESTTFEGSGTLATVFSPTAGDEDRIVRINIDGFENEGEGEGEGGGGKERILARITSLGNLGTKAYEIKLNFCSDAEVSESHGGNSLQIFKSGNYIASDYSSDEYGSHGFTLRTKVKVSANGKGIEFDPSARTSISLGSEGETHGFFRNIVLQNGKVTIRSKEEFGENQRKAIVRLLISGVGANVRLDKGAAKMEDSGRSMEGGVAWSSAENRFVATDSNSILNGIENEDLEGDEFYSEEKDVESGVGDLPDCNTPAEEIDAVVGLDMSAADAQEMRTTCEPLRIDGGGLCWGNDDVRAAQEMYGSVCGGGGSGPGEGEGGGPGEGEPS